MALRGTVKGSARKGKIRMKLADEVKAGSYRATNDGEMGLTTEHHNMRLLMRCYPKLYV